MPWRCLAWEPENQQACRFCRQQVLGSPETKGTAGFSPSPDFAGLVSDLLGPSANRPEWWLVLVDVGTGVLACVWAVMGPDLIRCSEQEEREPWCLHGQSWVVAASPPSLAEGVRDSLSPRVGWLLLPYLALNKSVAQVLITCHLSSQRPPPISLGSPAP